MISNPQPISGSITEQSGVEAESPKVTPILQIAWERYAQLNTLSKHRSRAFRRLRTWVAMLGILATLFAILTQVASEQQQQIVTTVIKIFFISTPIIASLLAAFGTRAFSNGDWLVTRAAAEEYLKEIYLYRTIHQKKKSRRDDLLKRIDEIQRQLYRGLGGELAFDSYKGRVPPYYNPDDPESDTGYDDLDGEKYFRFRLDNQLNWHQRRINEYKKERGILTFLVLAAGGLGTLFAALGESLSIWVALTASITAALIGWQELRNIDSVIKNYSKVIVELTSIHDYWLNLEPEKRTTARFYRMVRATEGVLWAQHLEYIQSQQEALKEADLDGESEESEAILKQTLQDNIMEATEEALDETKKEVQEPFKAALGSLAAEASAEVIQPELEAMGKAVAEAVGTMQERTDSMTESLQEITEEIADAEISGNTSEEEVSDTPARFPETGEPAG
jgi:DNA-binding protein YbaB